MPFDSILCLSESTMSLQMKQTKVPLKHLDKRKPWHKALFYTFGWFSRILCAVLFSTCRINVFGREIEKRYKMEHPGKGLLFASWHRGVMVLIYFFRFRRFVVMASASKDGELANQAVKRHGWIAVRGSSSYRGMEALREMIPYFKNGHYGGLVVDAPTGPTHVSKIGIILAARMTGLPILPVMWSADNCWRLKNWDRTIIPKPFSNIIFVYAQDVIPVPQDASREQCEKIRQHLDKILNWLMFQADSFFSTPEIDDPRNIVVTDRALKKHLDDVHLHTIPRIKTN
jgi:lysophospholipid acyltransferase (LPLAT)-like uncharacterized protein